MSTDLANISSSHKITNFLTWPIQKKENSIRTAIPIISFIATKTIANVSYLHSLGITLITLLSTEFIIHQINKQNDKQTKVSESQKKTAISLAKAQKKETHTSVYDKFNKAHEENLEKRNNKKNDLKSSHIPTSQREVKTEVKKNSSPRKKNGLFDQLESKIDIHRKKKHLTFENISLKEKNNLYLPIGKLLVHKSLCTEESYKNPSVEESFKFFGIDSNTIKEAWKNSSAEDEYDSRLEYISGKSDNKFNSYFETLKKDTNLYFKIFSEKTL